MGRIVMVVAALAAFVLNVNLLRSNDDLRSVAVAAAPIDAGTVVTGDMLEFVEMDAPDAFVARLVEHIEGVEGLVASVDIPAGEPIARSRLRESAAEHDLRAFTVAVDPTHAGGGGLIAPGDLVDVIAVDADVARYVVTGASVLDVADVGERGLVASSDYYLVVAVDSDTALELAEALRADSIEVIRATGAPTPDRLTLEASPEESIGAEAVEDGR